MKLSTYLNFNGNCEEAFNFYAGCLGGEIEAIMRWGGSPVESQVSSDWHEKVLHASLIVGHDHLLGCDVPPDNYDKPQSFGLPLTVDNGDDGQRIFNALAEGGEVQMPFEKAFFAERFGMVRDRFGIPWMIIHHTTTGPTD